MKSYKSERESKSHGLILTGWTYWSSLGELTNLSAQIDKMNVNSSMEHRSLLQVSKRTRRNKLLVRISSGTTVQRMPDDFLKAVGLEYPKWEKNENRIVSCMQKFLHSTASQAREQEWLYSNLWIEENTLYLMYIIALDRAKTSRNAKVSQTSRIGKQKRVETK